MKKLVKKVIENTNAIKGGADKRRKGYKAKSGVVTVNVYSSGDD